MTEPGVPRTQRGARRLVRLLLGGAALVLLTVAVVVEREDTAAAVSQLGVGTILLSLALVLVGLTANMVSWQHMLAALGSPLPVATAARVFLVAQIGKYLPGSLWPLLAQVELGRDHGVPRARSAAAGLAALLVGLIVGVMVAVAGLGLSTGVSATSALWLLAITPGLAVLLRPRLLEHLLDMALRLGRRPPRDFTVDDRELRHCAIWSFWMWLSMGAHVWLLARGLGADHPDLLLLSIGAYAAAWITGFLVIFSPAGAGAREAALVVTLAPALAHSEALALAVVSRVLTVVGDGVMVGCAMLLSWLLRRAIPPGATADTGAGDDLAV